MIIGDVVTVKIEKELCSGVVLDKIKANIINPRENFNSEKSFIYKVLVGDQKLYFTKNSFL